MCNTQICFAAELSPSCDLAVELDLLYAFKITLFKKQKTNQLYVYIYQLGILLPCALSEL